MAILGGVTIWRYCSEFALNLLCIKLFKSADVYCN